jgi:hypothetical protein
MKMMQILQRLGRHAENHGVWIEPGWVVDLVDLSDLGDKRTIDVSDFADIM